ncbi:Hypothetical predicted protein, partial [Olea europaea subsp. europaea]
TQFSLTKKRLLQLPKTFCSVLPCVAEVDVIIERRVFAGFIQRCKSWEEFLQCLFNLEATINYPNYKLHKNNGIEDGGTNQ